MELNRVRPMRVSSPVWAWKRVFRYLSLWKVFVANSLALELEYRAAFIGQIVIAITQTAWQLVAIWVFFVHRDHLGTWTMWEAVIVLGLYIFFDGTIEMFFRPNLERIVEHVRLGTMDFILLKPIDSQFLATTRHIHFRHVGDVVAGLGVAVYALWRLNVEPRLMSIAAFIVLLFAGGIILYSLLLVLVTFSFWFVNVTNAIELIWSVYEAGRFPIDIYPQGIRWVLTFVIPIAFITTVPAEALLGRISPRSALTAMMMAVFSLIVSSLFWRYATKHYTSASS